MNEAQARAVEKYSVDGPFREPLVRCEGCNQIIFVADLHKYGMCSCSHTRVKNIRALTEDDMAKVSKWVDEGKLDPDWLALWEVKE